MHLLRPGHPIIPGCDVSPVSPVSSPTIKTINRTVGHFEKLRVGAVGVWNARGVILPVIVGERSF